MGISTASLDKERRIEEALEKCSQEENPLSAQQASRIYEVSVSTITRRLKGTTKSHIAKSEAQQRLTRTEEDTVIKWAIQYSQWGLPIGISHLRHFATEILHRKDPHSPPLGVNWHQQLLSRHPEVHRVMARGLDRTRAATMQHPETLREYFELYRSLKEQYNIADQDTYNMDEKGFLMGTIQQEKVIIPVQQREAFLRQDGNREWVSVIETISADGCCLPSYIIFKAINQQKSWFEALEATHIEGAIATSPKGWTGNELGLLWLTKHFDIHTSKRQQGEYRMLILDGHESHCTLEFIEFCVERKIILLVLPPHTTHLLQPLDVAIFQPLAKFYSREISEHSRTIHCWLKKEDFIMYYGIARENAIDDHNIMDAWKATGLIPFDPAKILSKLPITVSVQTSEI